MHLMLTSPLHAGAVKRKHVTSAKIDPAKVSLSPGVHTVQATVRFKDPAWKQLVLTGCARGPDACRHGLPTSLHCQAKDLLHNLKMLHSGRRQFSVAGAPPSMPPPAPSMPPPAPA